MARARTAPIPLVDPGSLLATTHRLDDGLPVRLRLTRPSDAVAVENLLLRLSPESRALRVESGMSESVEEAARHFTFYSPRSRLVVAATAPADGLEVVFGLGDVELFDTGQAEFGLVVDDDFQGRGLGRLLSEAVATLALRNGATRLRAVLPRRDGPVLALMRRLGSTVLVEEDGRAVAYTRLGPGRSRRAR
jgi:acetyltransferase